MLVTFECSTSFEEVVPLGITHHNLDHRHSDRGLQWRPKSKRLRSIQHQDLTLHHLLHQGHVFVAAAAAAAAGILGQDRIRLEDHIHRHIHRHIPPGDHIRLRSQDQDHNLRWVTLRGISLRTTISTSVSSLSRSSVATLRRVLIRARG